MWDIRGAIGFRFPLCFSHENPCPAAQCHVRLCAHCVPGSRRLDCNYDRVIIGFQSYRSTVSSMGLAWGHSGGIGFYAPPCFPTKILLNCSPARREECESMECSLELMHVIWTWTVMGVSCA